MMRRLLFVFLLVGALLAAALPTFADIPKVTASGSLAATGDSVVLSLVGQSTCSMTLGGTWTGTVTPKGSGDNGATYNTVSEIGAQTSNGTFAGSASSYATNFKLTFTRSSGTLAYYIACTAAANTAAVSVTVGTVSVSNTPGVNVQNFPTQPILCLNSTVVNVSSATTTAIAAVSGSTAVYACDFSLYIEAGTLPTFQFEYGTGTACAVGATALTGTYGGIASAVGAHFALGNGNGSIFHTPASNGLCLVTGGTTPNVQGVVTWAQQ